MTLDDWHNRESKALQVMLDGKYLFLINAKLNHQSFICQRVNGKRLPKLKNSVIQQCDVSGIAFEVLEHMDDENDGVCYEK